MLYGQDEQPSIKEYFVKKPVWVWIAIFVFVSCGFGFGGYGIYQLVSTNDQEIVTSNDISSQVCEQTADLGQITVYISGAVKTPGVYVLESGDRVIDLLNAGGGISSSADILYVNRQFNLAQHLNDGEQLYIPTQVETEEQLALQSVVDNSNTSSEIQKPISINSSTENELMELSGIGETRAAKIVENRPYGSIQELVEKGVLSRSLLQEIEAQISL